MARLSDSITYGNHAITGNVDVGGTLTIGGVVYQQVALTGGTNVTISGTYPNLTISSVNTNTTYSAGTGLSLSGTSFSLDLRTTGFGGTYPMVVNISGILYEESAVTYNGTTNTLTAPNFSGNGSGLTSLNASNISTGTLASARLPSIDYQDLAGAADVDGDISYAGDVESGRGSGGVALTINDGQGNANVTFNHRNGVAEQAGNVARIEVNTDGTSGAYMGFHIADNATAGAVSPPQIVQITPSGLSVDIGTISGDGSGLTGTASLRATGTTKTDVGLSLVSNKSSTSASTANTVVERNASGDINARLFRSEYDTTNPTFGFIMTQNDTVNDNYIRPTTPAQFRAAVTDGSYLGVNAKAADSDKLDNLNSSQFLRSDQSDSMSGNLSVTGTITATGNITAYSDIRLKTNIEVIPEAINKVKQISGYTFDRTDSDVPRQTGVIAQELLKVLPEAVTGGPTEEDPDGHYSVAYGNIVGLLIEAVKEQQKQIDELKRMID